MSDLFTPQTKSPIPGIEIRRNEKNGFVVFQLHYSADERKRDPAYMQAIKGAMPRAQYLQEYEIVWDSYAGLPVYGDFDEKRHVPEVQPEAEVGLPLLRGWDFGLTPACVIAQLQGERFVVLHEIVETNMGVERFSDLALAECASLFPTWSRPNRDWFDFMDPAGEQRKDTDEGTCAKVLDSKGLTPIAGAIAFEERRKAVESFLIRQTRDGPGFWIWPGTCPVLVRGFKGGYRYPEKAAEIEPARLRPLKDEHSHPHDALQYIATRLKSMGNSGGRPIPQLRYSTR